MLDELQINQDYEQTLVIIDTPVSSVDDDKTKNFYTMPMGIIITEEYVFTISIKEEEILKEVDRLASELNRDLADKEPLFLGMLNGSFMFMSDLMKRITIPCQLQFLKM